MNTKERVLQRIQQLSGNVVLRSEVAEIGSRSQVSRALRALCEAKALVRMGQGVYAKTRTSSVTGATIPAGSLELLASEALEKLGVVAQPGQAARSYNEGRTMQLPGGFTVNTGRRRISRKLVVGGRAVVYEND